ncbi:unnamed protein product [Nippostrongylus brasiliensis]|uniref:DUF148 domain-containing protein n=1 Tax=Nippostrongylus brasiliensis TaxID=27835 RepID=A0A0N4XZY2_NIPBR|nr:unnamed protein product [Nippostrongylus brasiliensis]
MGSKRWLSGVITQRQLEADGREWAKKNRVLSRYEKFLADKEKEQEKSQKDIKEAMAALTAFFDQLAEIQNDKDITQNNAKELTRKLTGSLTRKQSQIASFVMRQFAPHLKCQGGSPLGNLLSMFGRYNGRYKRSVEDFGPMDSSFVSTDGAMDLLENNIDRALINRSMVLSWRNDSVVLN